VFAEGGERRILVFTAGSRARRRVKSGGAELTVSSMEEASKGEGRGGTRQMGQEENPGKKAGALGRTFPRRQ